MPFVSVNGAAVHYAVHVGVGPGGGPAMVFVHGAGGTLDCWRFQMRHFSLRRDVLAVDLPGHGESQGEGYRTIAEYRDFLSDLLDALAFTDVALVGHSMGGGIAQSFALTHPDRVKALVLVGTGARLRVHPDIFAAIRRDMGEAARLISQRAYSPTCMLATVAAGAEAFARNRTVVLERDFLACNAFDLMDEVAAIRVPTLILCGEEDRLTPVKFARFLQQQILGAELTILPNAGHMVMLEKPSEFNRTLAAFLDTHLGSAQR